MTGNPSPAAPALPLDLEAFLTQWHQPFLRLAAQHLPDPAAAEQAVLHAAALIYCHWPDLLGRAAPTLGALEILQDVLAACPRPDPASPLRSALAELEAHSPLQAHCVRLRHLAGLPYRTVALTLNIDQGAAKAHTWAGLRFLDARLARPVRPAPGTAL
ncbi:hypothetical protein ACEZCY_34710 [Streptacidiphilus sp. N1-12]|uniref:DNA-directed RNA polymerase specialized sigma subunit, sigma24 family n=2 Tax=Streptacidiphilus alkalitolerans TaxID=3342712 RepID=A0ABV6WQL3_9ACTN